jgi:hypothetical protein
MKKDFVCQEDFDHKIWRQQIDLVYVSNKPCLVSPERLFISLRFDDAGDSLVTTFLLPFSL